MVTRDHHVDYVDDDDDDADDVAEYELANSIYLLKAKALLIKCNRKEKLTAPKIAAR